MLTLPPVKDGARTAFARCRNCWRLWASARVRNECGGNGERQRTSGTGHKMHLAFRGASELARRCPAGLPHNYSREVRMVAERRPCSAIAHQRVLDCRPHIFLRGPITGKARTLPFARKFTKASNGAGLLRVAISATVASRIGARMQGCRVTQHGIATTVHACAWWSQGIVRQHHVCPGSARHVSVARKRPRRRLLTTRRCVGVCSAGSAAGSTFNTLAPYASHAAASAPLRSSVHIRTPTGPPCGDCSKGRMRLSIYHCFFRSHLRA